MLIEGARLESRADVGCGAGRFGAEGAEILAGAFLHCSRLRTLDLSWNDLGVKGRGRLKRAFLDNSRTDVVLNLANN